MLYTPEQYQSMREAYCYCDRDCEFKILPTPSLDCQFVRKYRGIFAKLVPSHYSAGINLRRFELLVRAIFEDIDREQSAISISNLKEIVCALVHWKMASQGGRANVKAANVKNKWREETTNQLVNAYRKKNMPMLEIGGIRIPTATAFMRFIFPEEY